MQDSETHIKISLTSSQAHIPLAPYGVSWNRGASRGKWGHTGICRNIQGNVGNTGEYWGIQGNLGEYREIKGNTGEFVILKYS